jgi:hypothetical protein
MITVPLPKPAQSFTTQRTSLGGTSYRLDFRWNSRVSRWYFSLYDSEDAAIVVGRPLVTGWPLLFGVSAANRPIGELILYTSDDLDPDLDTIAQATLYYAEPVA